jgi:hypothetical protein
VGACEATETRAADQSAIRNDGWEAVAREATETIREAIDTRCISSVIEIGFRYRSGLAELSRED